MRGPTIAVIALAAACLGTSALAGAITYAYDAAGNRTQYVVAP